MTITGKEGEAGSTYPRSDVAETIEPVEPVEPKGAASSRSLSQTDGPPPEPAHELPRALTSEQLDLATRPGTVEETTYRYQPVDDVTEAGPIRARSDPGSHVTGDYDLLGILGKGGMGVVYEARHRRLNRVVALKMMRDGSLPDDSELIRFRNEAEAVARLDHPHIVPIYEVGEAGGKPYLSMKLVRGESLAELVPKMTADYRSSAVVVGKAAAAVQHAHERGILHRDLKPANVLVDERGEPHVTDFGLARRIDKESDLTQSGAIMGTPGYVAPEQAEGRREAVTTSADVYGLGAILYALLTGRAPFVGDSVYEIIRKVREWQPDPPSRLNPSVPRDLEIICLKCLEKDPRRRYPSAAALAEDLDRWVQGEPIAARPVGSAERFWKWCRRRPALSGLAALLVLALAVGVTGIAVQWRRAEANLRKAQDRFDLGMESIGSYSTGASADVLLKEPKLSALRTRLLEGAITFYEKLGRALEGETDLASRRSLASALYRAADLNAKVGSAEKGLEAAQRAMAIRRILLDRNLKDSASRRELANNQIFVGECLLSMGRFDDARRAFEEARTTLQPLVTGTSTDDDAMAILAASYRAEGTLSIHAGKPGPAVDNLKRALEILTKLSRESRESGSLDGVAQIERSAAECLDRLGQAHTYTCQYEESLRVLEEERPILEGLTKRHPDDLDDLYSLANCYRTIGSVMLRTSHSFK